MANCLPKSWTKLFVQAVLSDNKGRKSSLKLTSSSLSKLELCHIEVTTPDGILWYCRDAHEESFYFQSGRMEVRISTHWRCKTSKKVNHVEACSYACIPWLTGKIETHRGFDAARIK